MSHDEAVLGIDLGTTNTVAAAMVDDKMVVIRDAEGRRLQPSVVAFIPSGETHVGEPARLRRIIDPENTIYSAKRIIGQPFDSPNVQSVISHLPFQVIEGARKEPYIRTRAGQFSVPQISAHVLSHMRELAQRQLRLPVNRCVITVPANFTDPQRNATRLAAEHAGLEVMRIINEPTAAALAYGATSDREQRIAIFDLGGGTFDLTLLAVRRGLFEVLATGGDAFLGGDDLDRTVAEHLAMEFLREHRVDLAQDPQAWARLLLVSEDIKRRLSTEDMVDDVVKDMAFGVGGKSLHLTVKITRTDFEALVHPIIERAVTKAEAVLAEAGVTPSQVDGFVLVGGSTKVPLVRNAVSSRFQTHPRAEIDPMVVVAGGAAMQAARLAEPEDMTATAMLLVDVTSHALGIGTAGGYADEIIPKNTPIPAEGRKRFTTARDGQDQVILRVCQGSSRKFVENAQVGELIVAGLRPAERGAVSVEVSFLIDADGVLSVSAIDCETGRTTAATLQLVGVTMPAPRKEVPRPRASAPPPPVPGTASPGARTMVSGDVAPAPAAADVMYDDPNAPTIIFDEKPKVPEDELPPLPPPPGWPESK